MTWLPLPMLTSSGASLSPRAPLTAVGFKHRKAAPAADWAYCAARSTTDHGEAMSSSARVGSSIVAILLGTSLLTGCGAANSSQCNELLVKKMEADTLAITAMGDRVAEMSKAKPDPQKLEELDIKIIALESLSDNTAAEMDKAGC